MKKLIALMALLPILFVGCGKEGPADTPEGEFADDPWLESLGKTPKNRTPTYQKAKGDTMWPIDVWRSVGEAKVEYELSPSGDEADFDIDIKWPDTVVVVYQNVNDSTDIDTVIKPSPEFSGDLKFHYKIVDKDWKLTALTPVAVRSDSAGNYVKLDSIKCEVLNRNAGTFPVLNDPSALISCYPIDDYPYTFQKGDSVKVVVYVSGTDTTKFVLLFAPIGDNPDWFNHEGDYWHGTWVTNTVGHHWVWISVCDWDIIWDPDMKAARSVLWGIPYKVE